jgi:RNA polymerase sigma factor (sigma-70 family)
MNRYESLSDADLLDACREGQAEAWDALVARYERLVYTIPFRYGLTKSEADDVFQSVWTTLLAHLPTLKQPDRIAAWLVTTARRECWDRRRGAGFERIRSVDPAEMPETDPWFQGASAEDIVARHERHRRLHEALRQLQERCRRLLHYLYNDPHKLPYSEIAVRLNMAVGSIGPTRARCLEKLRELLESS